MPNPGDVLRHDPDALLVYEMDWTSWLEGTAIVQTSAWSISPTGPTLDNESIVTGSKKTRVRISAATAGEIYTVTNRVTTDENPAQTDDRSFVLMVTEQ